MRHGLNEYTKAVMELAKAEALANGEQVYHSFRGELYPNDKHDVEWMRDVMDNYIAQERIGLSCLLANRIRKVKEVRDKLNKKLESM